MNSTRLSALLLFAVVIIAVKQTSVSLYASEPSTAENPLICHTIDSEQDDIGNFAPPFDYFGKFKRLSIIAFCKGRSSVQVRLGNGDATQYIYKYGYRKVDGVWKKTTYSGAKTVGSWIVGSAVANIEGVKEGDVGEILAYMCQKVGSEWKCGCFDKECATHKLQMQKYELTEEMFKYSVNPTTDFEKKKMEEMMQKKSLDVYFLSKKMAYAGTKVVITGVGFSTSSKNEIMWNDVVKQSGLVSKDGTQLSITVPNILPARYEVKVRVAGKVSEYGLDFWILTPGQVTQPKIKSISPKTGKQGDVFTIYGEGFTKSNDVLTMFAMLKGLPSEDGTSISFKYDPFDRKLEAWEKKGVPFHYQQPITVRVYNASGVSNVETFSLDI